MTHPPGTVTFLFTEIEGSTKLAQQYLGTIRDFCSKVQAMSYHAGVAGIVDVPESI